MIQSFWRKLWQNQGGLNLDDQKEQSTQHAVRRIATDASPELIIPLQQHMGDKPEVRVKPGDYVYKGQRIAAAEGDVSVPIHASTSGTILALELRPIAHPSGLDDLCIILQPDGLDDPGDSCMEKLPDYTQVDPALLRRRICEAGIVGLGGAVFPAAIKLNVRPQIPITTLVVNGAECEPYITCDDMLMREQPDEIIAGSLIMLHILQSHAPPEGLHCLIGVEDNKPQAIAALQAAALRSGDARVQIVAVPTLYPTGGEKQLIKALTGKEVPSGGRPADAGMICHNVATARAIYRAVVLGEPLISRYVTLTGNGIAVPQNMEVPFGMPMQVLIEQAGGYTRNARRLVMGGPMMGVSLGTDRIPVVKATNCILVTDQADTPQPALPCIRCGKCAEVCPAKLLPQQLYWHARARELEQTEKYHLFDCIECGCCAYVCPSHIPLVDYYRFAKADIREQRAGRIKSDLARERHEFRQERIERAKREKAEKLAQHKQALQEKQAGDGGSNDKKAAIQAALERAKARKAQQQATATATTIPAENTSTGTDAGTDTDQDVNP